MKRIIIDTDPGQDDALALMLLFKSGLFSIPAVTTVAGNSTIENVTRNARYILSLIKADQTPVYSGKGTPLSRDLIQAIVHGESGLDGVDTSAFSSSVSGDAAERIRNLVLSHPNELTILTLGPLTNIAQTFLDDPNLSEKITEIVIMGGAIAVPGNKNRVAEFNIFVDPEAASTVFQSSVKKTLIPLDVCNDVVLEKKDFEALGGTTYYVEIMAMMEKYIKAINLDEGINGAIMYDAVAAYYLINPAAFTTVEMDIEVETKGNETRGMTVVERRAAKVKKINCRVAMKVDVEVFKRDFLEMLNRPS